MKKKLRNHLIPHKGNNYVPHTMRNQSLIATSIIAIALVGLSVFGTQNVPRSSLLAKVQASLLVFQTNENRVENSIDSLTVNPQLEAAARMKALDMLQNDYFAHVSPDGHSPWYWMNKSGYKYKYAGENLATGFYETDDVTDAWLNSPLHKRNIMNGKYTEIGLAVETGRVNGRNVTYIVQMFGSPRYASVVATDRLTLGVTNPVVESVIADSPTLITNVLGDETEFQGTYMETVYDGYIDPNLVIQDENTTDEILANNKPNFLVSMLAQPNKLARLALLALIIILSFALFVKIATEYKRHHIKHIVWTSVILLLLITLYIWLDYSVMKGTPFFRQLFYDINN